MVRIGVAMIFALAVAACTPAAEPVVVLPSVDAAASGDRADAAVDPPTAGELYDRAETLRLSGRLDEARARFVELAQRYPYALAGRRAELRIADIDFALHDYAKAAAEYATYAHDHPSDLAAEAKKRAVTAECLAAKRSDCVDTYAPGP